MVRERGRGGVEGKGRLEGRRECGWVGEKDVVAGDGKGLGRGGGGNRGGRPKMEKVAG